MPEFDVVMLWAACDAVGVLGLLWFFESGRVYYTVSRDLRPAGSPSVSDVAVDFRSSPSMIWLKWKQSKTDPSRRGVDILLGCTSSSVAQTPISVQLQEYARISGPTRFVSWSAVLVRRLLSIEIAWSRSSEQPWRPDALVPKDSQGTASG